jgi:hypothetical protein
VVWYSFKHVRQSRCDDWSGSSIGPSSLIAGMDCCAHVPKISPAKRDLTTVCGLRSPSSQPKHVTCMLRQALGRSPGRIRCNMPPWEQMQICIVRVNVSYSRHEPIAKMRRKRETVGNSVCWVAYLKGTWRVKLRT